MPGEINLICPAKFSLLTFFINNVIPKKLMHSYNIRLPQNMINN